MKSVIVKNFFAFPVEIEYGDIYLSNGFWKKVTEYVNDEFEEKIDRIITRHLEDDLMYEHDDVLVLRYFIGERIIKSEDFYLYSYPEGNHSEKLKNDVEKSIIDFLCSYHDRIVEVQRKNEEQALNLKWQDDVRAYAALYDYYKNYKLDIKKEFHWLKKWAAKDRAGLELICRKSRRYSLSRKYIKKIEYILGRKGKHVDF